MLGISVPSIYIKPYEIPEIPVKKSTVSISCPIPHFKLSTLISISLFILIIIPIGNIMHKISLKTQTETANFSAFLNKIFTEIRLVKVFNTEYKEIENSKKKIK